MTRFFPRTSTTTTLLIGLAMVPVGLTGCASNPAKSSRLMNQAETTEISAAELRIRVRALAGPFSGIIEDSADQAAAGTDDTHLRRQALLWKINGVPTIQAALFQPDPLAALMDVWALIQQVQNSLADGEAAALPDGIKNPITQATAEMESELIKIASLLGPDGTVARLESAANRWAMDHPLDRGLKSRSPTTSELAAITADSRVGIRKSVSALTEGLGDMAARVDVYVAYLPKQARWQAEYLIGDVIGGDADDLNGVIGEFAELSDAVTSIAGTVETIPEVISSERLAVFREVERERLEILEAIGLQMQSLFRFITAERKAAISGALREERIAVMEGVTAERIAAFQALREERIATMGQVEAMVTDLVEDSVKRVVDHAFLRLAQLLIVLVVILGIGAFLLTRSLRRNRSVA